MPPVICNRLDSKGDKGVGPESPSNHKSTFEGGTLMADPILRNHTKNVKREELTQTRLKEVLHYDPETGILTRKIRTSNRVRVGDEVGRDNRNGYLRAMVDHKTYYAHQLIWLYCFGSLPKIEIDHRDGNGMNNRLNNLRESTHAQNCQNLTIRSTNKSGFTGVSWHKQIDKWTANIWINNKRKYLGVFNSKLKAYEVYLSAKKELHIFQPIPRDMM